MTPLTSRMAGIVRSPRATSAQLAATASPPWLDVLAATTLVTFLSSAALLVTRVGQTALVDQWERVAEAFGRHVDDAMYARMQELSSHGVLYSAGAALLAGPVLTIVLAAAIAAAFRGRGTPPPPFTSVLSVVAHAGVILALRQLIATPVNYAAETLASPATLVRLVPGLDEASPLARGLGLIDVFVVWWTVVLALGVAALMRRRSGMMVLTFASIYLALAIVAALVMVATGGTT